MNAGDSSKIIGFICNWGAYSGAEMAGALGGEYPAIRLVRVACLGRLSLGMVLRAFEKGAEGVLLLGCPPEECHYHSGTESCRGVFSQARKLMRLLGMDVKRLEMVEVPLGGDEIFVRRVSAFTRYIERNRSEGAAWKISGR